MAKAMASASTAAQGALTKTPVPPFKPIPTEESTQAKRAVRSESTPIFAEIPTPQKEVTPTSASLWVQGKEVLESPSSYMV